MKGVKSKVFDYSNKKIISIDEWDKRVKSEINRVKNLTSDKNSPWICNLRKKKTEDPQLWEEDELLRVIGVADTTVERLTSCGVKNVKQLRDLPKTKEKKSLHDE